MKVDQFNRVQRFLGTWQFYSKSMPIRVIEWFAFGFIVIVFALIIMLIVWIIISPEPAIHDYQTSVVIERIIPSNPSA